MSDAIQLTIPKHLVQAIAPRDAELAQSAPAVNVDRGSPWDLEADRALWMEL